MNDTVLKPSTPPTQFILRVVLIVVGILFLLIGLGITLGIVYAGYTIISHPDPFSILFIYINAQDDVFVKWIINNQADEIEISRIAILIFIAIAFSILVQVIISFITLCVTSGKGLLSLSRNFSD